MSFKETLEKVQESEVFKEFINKNPDAELCAGFFIIDFISNDNKSSIDYKFGEKVYTFDLLDNRNIKMTEDELIKTNPNRELKKISSEIKIDIEDLKGLAGIKILDEGITSKFNKIIAVLQMYQEKQAWNLTCMLDGLIIINIIIDSDSGNIIKFERKSMMDLIRKK